MKRSPDVLAEVSLVPTSGGGRRSPVVSGYRPQHRVLPDYLTSGIHHYLDVDEIAPGASAQAHITFITPEAYPGSLSPGQIVEISEGSRVVGHARIIAVLNALLNADAADAT